MKRKMLFYILFLTVIGVFDSFYLTYEHYTNGLPLCPSNYSFINCGKVTTSPYAVIAGVPLALIGLLHYSILSLATWLASRRYLFIAEFYLITSSFIGLLVSFYLMYVQLVIIKSICLYCSLSAVISLLIFGLVMLRFSDAKYKPSNT